MATSLASSVGTRVESASRHMLQCRVHKDRYLSWNVANEELKKNKHQFSMTKDELAIDSASSLFPKQDHICKQPHPYPRVITTWRGLNENLMSVYCVLMAQKMGDYFQLMDMLQNLQPSTAVFGGPNHSKLLALAKSLSEKSTMIYTIPDFRAMGYSVGTAYAHEYNGDTIAAVMIGGLVTVQNGKYAMHTGDPVSWYVQYVEEICFDEHGTRLGGEESTNKLMNAINNVDHGRPTGKQGHSMRNSGYGDVNLKDNIFLPKPYFYKNASFGDTRRVFAKCLSNAAPYERVDIMIASQSI